MRRGYRFFIHIFICLNYGIQVQISKSKAQNFSNLTLEFRTFPKGMLLAKSALPFRGAGGIRTLVHTSNKHAFYMLSLSLIVGKYTGTNTQDISLAPKISFWFRGETKTSLKLLATRYQAGIRHLHLRAVSSPVTLTEDKAHLLYFD